MTTPVLTGEAFTIAIDVNSTQIASQYAAAAQTAAATATTGATTATTEANSAIASATSASNSAASALASQNSAASSASSAATSATALSAGLASFNTTWLGSKTADPTTDNNGNALVIGAEYLNTSFSPPKIRVYTSTGWQDQDQTAETASANATLSATQAATSATNAANSASSASTSATNAANSASSASTSATNASNSATSAATSATQAANSAASITFPIPVTNGGTGATTAAGARTDLGAAASGANSDITSLSGLTTALSVAQGGTGATTAAGALTSLGAAALAGSSSQVFSVAPAATASEAPQLSQVQAMRGQYQASASYATSQTLTASIVGASIGFTGTAAATYTLPSLASMQPLTTTKFFNNGTAALTIATSGTDKLVVASGQVSTIVMQPGDDLSVYPSSTAGMGVADSGSALRQYEPLIVAPATQSGHAVNLGQLENTASPLPLTTAGAPASDNSTRAASTAWIWSQIQALVSSCIAAVATAAGFSISPGGNGYIKLPSWLGGLIIQWGSATVTTTATITLPIAFPNAFLSATATIDDSAATTIIASVGVTASNATLGIRTNSSSPYDVTWMAIGH